MGMKDRLQEAVQKVQQERHLVRRSVAMVLVLAMLTSMSVSWRLHQDGVALAADAVHYYCGKEEHVHTDDCYIQGTEPTCGYYEGEIIETSQDSSAAGVDDDAQYNVDADDDSSEDDWSETETEPEEEPAAQAASEPEVVLHHHTADCYEEQEKLTCGYDDSDHVHDELCYDQETGELRCTEHVHDDDCYTIEEVPVCGYEEGEPEETDDGVALYDMDESNAVESSSAAEEPASEAEPESEPEQETTQPAEDTETDEGYTVHHHTDECYDKVLICGKEEHEHTAECLINPNAEIDAEYDAKTPARTDTDWADDMVLVAKSQLGYTESKADVDADGNGYTMYADQYYKDKPLVYADWDSTFVAYCLYHAGVPQDIIPQYASISALRGELARMNSEYYTDDPQNFAAILPGDIVMYTNTSGRETIGVVSDITVEDESGLTTALTVISGDVATGYESDGETTIDQVAEVSVDLNDVTSFVSVNGAYGYGVSDLMDDDEQEVASSDAKKLNEAATITNAVIKYYKNNNWEEIPPDYTITVGDEVQTWVEFMTTPETFANGITKLTYQLPFGLYGDLSAKDIMAEVNGQSIKVGTLTMDENGLATLNFNFDTEETVQLEKNGFEAYFWIQAHVQLDENSESGKVEFPGTKYEVNIEKQHDLTVQKNRNANGEWQDSSIKIDPKTGEKYIEFTISVSSTNGTDNKTVTITDYIGANTAAALKGNYDKGSFVLKDKNGVEVNIQNKLTTGEKEDPEDNNTRKQYFEIENIPAMKAGDSYTLTYRYKITGDAEVAIWPKGYFKNDVYAKYKEGKTPAHSYWEKTFDGSLISKSGKYNEKTRVMDWTITVSNPGANILDGYTIEDTLQTPGATIVNGANGFTVKWGDYSNKINNNLSGQSFKVTPASMENGNKTSFEYKFPENSNKKYYQITYSTTIPSDMKNNTQMENSVEIKDKKGNKIDGATGIGTVSRTDQTKLVKSVTSGPAIDSSDPTRLAVVWNATIKPPETSNSFFLTDCFVDLKVNHAVVKATKGQHYAYLNELKSQLTNSSTGNEGQGIHIFTTDMGANHATGGFNYQQAIANGIEITITYYSDNEFEQAVDDTPENATAKIRGYKIKVAQGSYQYPVYQMNVNRYTTYVDYTDALKDGQEWEIRNEISDGTKNEGYSRSYQEVIKKDSFKKKVGFNEWSFHDSVNVDYKELGDTTFWYELWLEPGDFKALDETSVTDTLPDGLEYAEEYHAYFHSDNSAGKNSNPYEIEQGEHVTLDQQGNTLTFNFKNLKALNTYKSGKKGIAVLFKVKVNDPDFWNDASKSEKPYTNKTSWNGGEEEKATATVKRGETFLIKTGKQNQSESGQNISEVTYRIIINKDGKDLIPNATTVTLTDELTVLDNADASIKETHLYRYSGDESNPCGASAEEDEIGFTTSVDGNKHCFYLTVPDNQAYVFEYTYTIDTTNVAPGADKTIKNSASLFGRVQRASDIQFSQITGGGGIKGTGSLTLRKVQRNMWDKFLPGAEFELTSYGAETGWSSGSTVTTNENGEIVFAINTGTEVQYDTLYKLQETEAPDGYVKDEKAVYYFIMLQKNQTKEEAFAQAVGSTNAGVDSNAANLIYAEYNKNTVLRVENSPAKLSVEKQWKYANGKMMSQEDKERQPDVTVKIYQYAAGSTPNKTADALIQEVELNKTNNWKADNIQLASADANLRYYAVEENAEGAGYTVTYWDALGHQMENNYQNGDTIVVVNQLKPTELTVTKKWLDSSNGALPSDKEPNSITLKLYRVDETGQKTSVQVGGSASVTMTKESGWKYTFTGLDPNAKYVVEEVGVTGFTVAYTYPDGADGTTGIAPGGTVTITNTEEDVPAYELPSTGSPGGTIPYTAGGAAIALAAVLCGYNSKRKKREEE